MAINRCGLGWMLGFALLGGCSADRIADLSNTTQSDLTNLASFPQATQQGAELLSAFYGLDDALPFFASLRICREFGHSDGMPVIFSREVDITTLEAGDFAVTLADGSQTLPGCVTPAPAEDPGEWRTVLLIGDFGSIDNQPVSVAVQGSVLSADHLTNFKHSEVAVTALEAGPTLVLAEVVPKAQWALGSTASNLPFGGGDGCPLGTQQVVRAVWSGGVTKPGGDEVDAVERAAYRVWVTDEQGVEQPITPFAIGDLGDGDNNHELCLDAQGDPLRVEFPAQRMTDPREDLNPATSIAVSAR